MATSSPDSWLVKNLHFLCANSEILDLACGSGRNARHLLSLGHKLTCVDIDIEGLTDLETLDDCQVIQADLENDNPWPLTTQFDGIIVTNYLHRPLFYHLVNTLKRGGILIYRTFMQGNEKYGRPRSPDFLLKENELLDYFGKDLKVLAFEQGYEEPAAMTQRICARKL
jgi:SAM-dependent methyltransferase